MTESTKRTRRTRKLANRESATIVVRVPGAPWMIGARIDSPAMRRQETR